MTPYELLKVLVSVDSFSCDFVYNSENIITSLVFRNINREVLFILYEEFETFSSAIDFIYNIKHSKVDCNIPSYISYLS